MPARRVLVVEDSVDTRDMLKIMLELDGHIVEVAEDGVEAVERAMTWKPEIALVDIGLPRLDGYEVARQLRARAGTRGMYLVAVTGYGREEDRRQANAAGFDLHLLKPIAAVTLSRVVATCPDHGKPTTN